LSFSFAHWKKIICRSFLHSYKTCWWQAKISQTDELLLLESSLRKYAWSSRSTGCWKNDLANPSYVFLVFSIAMCLSLVVYLAWVFLNYRRVVKYVYYTPVSKYVNKFERYGIHFLIIYDDCRFGGSLFERHILSIKLFSMTFKLFGWNTSN